MSNSLRSFNSRTPGGVRPSLRFLIVHLIQVSIHAPREGCDIIRVQLLCLVRFQFTHPGRGATKRTVLSILYRVVSIHAPREGCDAVRRSVTAFCSCFNSRTPGGVRLGRRDAAFRQYRFNSRTPGGVRRAGTLAVIHTIYVSIHAPREGCDSHSLIRSCNLVRVSIHAPREGCDCTYAQTGLSR